MPQQGRDLAGRECGTRPRLQRLRIDHLQLARRVAVEPHRQGRAIRGERRRLDSVPFPGERGLGTGTVPPDSGELRIAITHGVDRSSSLDYWMEDQIDGKASWATRLPPASTSAAIRSRQRNVTSRNTGKEGAL